MTGSWSSTQAVEVVDRKSLTYSSRTLFATCFSVTRNPSLPLRRQGTDKILGPIRSATKAGLAVQDDIRDQSRPTVVLLFLSYTHTLPPRSQRCSHYEAGMASAADLRRIGHPRLC